MNRSAQVRAARVAGGVVMLAAVIPAFTAGVAFAADAPEAPASVTTEAATTSYADEVAIGTAVKIAAPGVVKDEAPAIVKAADPTTSPSTQASSAATATSDPDATPSDAEVIETDSRQNATEDPTEVAVLGTKISSNELASTGPSKVLTQTLVALALIGAGLALRFGPSLVTAAGNRRH